LLTIICLRILRAINRAMQARLLRQSTTWIFRFDLKGLHKLSLDHHLIGRHIHLLASKSET